MLYIIPYACPVASLSGSVIPVRLCRRVETWPRANYPFNSLIFCLCVKDPRNWYFCM